MDRNNAAGLLGDSLTELRRTDIERNRVNINEDRRESILDYNIARGDECRRRDQHFVAFLIVVNFLQSRERNLQRARMP